MPNFWNLVFGQNPGPPPRNTYPNVYPYTPQSTFYANRSTPYTYSSANINSYPSAAESEFNRHYQNATQYDDGFDWFCECAECRYSGVSPNCPSAYERRRGGRRGDSRPPPRRNERCPDHENRDCACYDEPYRRRSDDRRYQSPYRGGQRWRRWGNNRRMSESEAAEEFHEMVDSARENHEVRKARYNRRYNARGGRAARSWARRGGRRYRDRYHDGDGYCEANPGKMGSFIGCEDPVEYNGSRYCAFHGAAFANGGRLPDIDGLQGNFPNPGCDAWLEDEDERCGEATRTPQASYCDAHVLLFWAGPPEADGSRRMYWR